MARRVFLMKSEEPVECKNCVQDECIPDNCPYHPDSAGLADWVIREEV